MSDDKKKYRFVDALEEEAIEQLKEIRERRINRTDKPEYRQRAKEAISVIGNYVRLRATMANERSNELIEQRMLGPVVSATPVTTVRAISGESGES